MHPYVQSLQQSQPGKPTKAAARPLRALGSFLARFWQRLRINRRHQLSSNALEGASPRVLLDLGVPPELIAESQALENLQKYRDGHLW
jgi:hypothetical protein